MSSTDESGAGMADTDINSTDADGTNVPGHDDGSDGPRRRARATTPTAATSTAATPSTSRGTARSTRPAATGPSTTRREQTGTESDAADLGDSGQDNGLTD